ncbi:CGNR zinc finger domain-containing protein [Candidatus Solirubrobacter pratensis]|uniref:CGNR zinc finger domain-containing protein n=1 Tax=Candidatus Solirubrobacter pratensis TaxID=1298857 RepID=UPI000400FBF3|nr:CGNR zinc finger domain-containing protein [Candidatus Solirubrobacter pratensis]
MSSLAADLVNTRPRPADPPEKLTGPDAVAALLEPYGLEPAPVEELREVRGRLLTAFEARDMGELAAALNPLLARGATLRLLPAGWATAAGGSAPGGEAIPGGEATPGGSSASTRWSLRAPTEELSPADRIAVTAATELAALAAERGLDRLRFCAAHDCQRVFADTSPRGDRRYCSRTCSTRMNVRRHRSG